MRVVAIPHTMNMRTSANDATSEYNLHCNVLSNRTQTGTTVMMSTMEKKLVTKEIFRSARKKFNPQSQVKMAARVSSISWRICI